MYYIKKLLEKSIQSAFLKNDKKFQAIFFNNNQTLPDKIKAVYSIDANEFNGNKSLQIIIKSIVE